MDGLGSLSEATHGPTPSMSKLREKVAATPGGGALSLPSWQMTQVVPARSGVVPVVAVVLPRRRG